ncbi:MULTISPECIES: acetyl-CoA C-acetyltransferase [Gemella]|uniref:acetyl-CoA C-acetyltransferase n=1 Tax=Gemella TaxID=1378 RepID=UPI000767FE5E|nr:MULTISPECIES: acetyl-CoA C-acetyltransferase [Gemella]AME08715.1 acetyl-CoA acetyltransferase [Gemella sp. oral taxon 928]AXI26290.1 acetyl-CoA C-acetyltransferase [Gemella sp. ND 6198]
MTRVAIVSAFRSAIGAFGGSLKDIDVAELGAKVVKYSLDDINLEYNLVDEVIFGNVLQGGLGQNIARQISVKAGLSKQTPAFVVNKVCGSGLKSVLLGTQSILLGDNDIVVCGGLEVMSGAPYYTKGIRFGKKLGSFELEDSIISDGLTDAFENYHMGITAENIAEKFNISRKEQDFFAFDSQKKAQRAIETGKFKKEIVPIKVKIGKEECIFDTDEFPRFNSTMEGLGKLRPAFKKEGTVTAGNSSGINDGAAAVILMNEKRAIELGIEPLVFIEGYATSGLDNKIMGLGPVPAVNKVLTKLNISKEEVDLFELNEAFAAQSLAVINELGVDSEKVNINGGAIALGHPIGASGTRILVSLVHELIHENKKRGLCSLCIGGGQGIALVIHRN